MKAPVAGISRLRMQTDGKGITTLVCFHGCPLRCKWCINPFTWDPSAKTRAYSPEELYRQVRCDALYYLSTGGGITFGGGEPLLYSEFLEKFRALSPQEWHICAETSLAVPWEQVRRAADCIDLFYVDVKDTNPEIYRSYTGKDNALMLENLQKLLSLTGPERIVVRLPLIPDFNSEQDRYRSKALLQSMGVTRFDEFGYKRTEEYRPKP